MSKTVLKVCGGWWWFRPILVFSLSLDQAEQKNKAVTKVSFNLTSIMHFGPLYLCNVTWGLVVDKKEMVTTNS